MRLAGFAYARTCTSHTKPPSKMHYLHFVYLYWLSTRVRKRNVSILFKTIEKAAEVTSTLTLNRHFWVMFNENFRSNGTSGQNTEYHLLFVWTSSTSNKKQNVSILSTHDDNRCHVSIPLFDLISRYMSFSNVTRPLPVKWHFRSKRHISSVVDMTRTNKQNVSIWSTIGEQGF
jgi:hypothetical protein